MNKLELKKNAIESLNASGSLFEKGQYKEALAMAQQAWDCYFELQKLRDSDEDFTDLIYAARTQYNKCRTALDELEHEENNSLAKEYEEVLVWKEKGESGDYKEALKAADWFANPDHWALLNEKGVTSNDFLTYATHLYQSVVDHETIWPEYRALAAYNIGKVHEVADRVLSICSEPSSTETIIQKLFRAYGLRMDFQQYALVGSTIRSYLSWLHDSGSLSVSFDSGMLLWERR